MQGLNPIEKVLKLHKQPYPAKRLTDNRTIWLHNFQNAKLLPFFKMFFSKKITFSNFALLRYPYTVSSIYLTPNGQSAFSV
jgi:hypothetical protein